MATGIDNASDETFTFKCSPCAEDNKIREAVKYCVECQGYCCQSCADVHTKFPVLKKHTLLDRSHFQADGARADLPAVPTERCCKHKLKIVDMFCEDHDLVGCALCMALEHRSCSKIHSITDSIDTLWQKDNIEKITKTLEEMKIEMSTILDKRISDLDVLEQSRNKAASAIKDYRKELDAWLDCLEKKTMEILDTKFQTSKSKMVAEKNQSETSVETLQKTYRGLQHATGNKAQQFVSFKNAEHLIKITKNAVSSLKPFPEDKLEFFPKWKREKFIRELGLFGHVRSKVTPYSIDSRKVLNVKILSDKATCDIDDMCLSEEGYLLMVDCENIKLKRTDRSCTSVVDFVDLPEIPRSVCCLSKLEAAVALNNKSVQTISLGQKMTLIKLIQLDHSCVRISRSNGKIYIGGYDDKLRIYDTNFNILKSISKENIRNDLFANSRKVAFSDSGDRLFVSDRRKGLVILDDKYNYITTLTCDEVKNADGICTDGRGSMFLSGYSSNNVVQLSQQGTRIGNILGQSDGINDPQSICFKASNNTLFVALLNSDVIRVFELS